MKFIEADSLARQAREFPAINIRLVSSCNLSNLTVYLEALLSRFGRSLNLETTSFGGLQHFLRTQNTQRNNSKDIYFLLPWDFVPEFDWRNGFPSEKFDLNRALNQANQTAELLLTKTSDLVFLDAPKLPISQTLSERKLLDQDLLRIVASLGAKVIDASVFSLGSYFVSGNPVGGSRAFYVANKIFEIVRADLRSPRKVLACDFDNVLWSGIIAEDELGAINASPDGPGFKHFVFQGFLRKLQQEGVIIIGVTRNEYSVAIAPLSNGTMRIGVDCFTEIIANYEPKSKNIVDALNNLGLGLDSVVFVDDNPLEIAEVQSSLIEVECVRFPSGDEDFPDFLERLSDLFALTAITEEDRNRTENYRKMKAFKTEVGEITSGSVEEYLRSLEMKLTVRDIRQDSARALQLINRTNQFNLNGHRFLKDDLESVLEMGGKMYVVELADRTGEHGGIMVALIDSNDCLLSWVMSCRVFLREVEYVFLCWLNKKFLRPLTFKFVRTEKNLPMYLFLQGNGLMNEIEDQAISLDLFASAHNVKTKLFTIEDMTSDGI